MSNSYNVTITECGQPEVASVTRGMNALDAARAAVRACWRKPNLCEAELIVKKKLLPFESWFCDIVRPYPGGYSIVLALGVVISSTDTELAQARSEGMS